MVIPSALYLKTNTPSKIVRIMKLEKEMSEVTEDGSEIYRSSLLEYYMSRPRQKSNIQNIVL